MLQWNSCNREVKQMNFCKCLLEKTKKHFPLLQLNRTLLQTFMIMVKTGHTLHVRDGSRKEQGKCTVPANLNIL